MTAVVLPGATIGIVGGGQLGRMMAIEARRLGYGVIGLDPTGDGPLGQVADRMIVADYDDLAAAREMADACDLITYEFENIPSETLSSLADAVPVLPHPTVLKTTRHRRLEKTFLRDHGFPVAAFATARTKEQFAEAVAAIGMPCIAKTCEFGYDGKGQRRLDDEDAIEQAWQDLTSDERVDEVIIEALVPFSREASVICTRREDGTCTTFPVFENEHRNHILSLTRMPARLEPAIHTQLDGLAKRVTEALEVVGTLCIELFLVDGPDGSEVLINELAPRPHNSGHVTIEACVTDQFAQHVRAICGLPLGSTQAVEGGGAMLNLLGDLWADGEPDWAAALAADARLQLHLYGKARPAAGRKMGHCSCSAADLEEAVTAVREAQRILGRS